MKTLNLIIFYIQFHIFMYFNRLFGKKSRRYMMIFLGRFPENFKHGIKPVIDYSGDVRFTFGPGSLIILFNPKKRMVELKTMFDKVYGEYTDILFIFDITSNDFGKIAIPTVSKHLFDEDTSELTNDEKIDKIHLFIEMVVNMRDEVKKEILRHMDEMDMEDAEIINEDDASFGNVTEDELDSIIDKVSTLGYDSLTPDEKETFDKIFKK